MLVLSRHPKQKIVFPTIGVTVQVLSVKGGVVRIGIDAPDDMSVLREELVGKMLPAKQRHDLLNRLNKASLSLHLLRNQLEAGQEDAAAATLEKAMPLLADLEREAAAAPPAAASSKPRTANRALVVEDDANERELLASFLKLNGLHCHTAEDGSAALDFLANQELPDFVLLDLWMPKCDGAVTLRAIRANPRLQGLKVYAVSGTSPAEAGLSVGPGGLDAWFPKPVNAGRLLKTIKKELGAGLGAN